MPEFCLTYAQIVILETDIKAGCMGTAQEKADELSIGRRLGLGELRLGVLGVKKGSRICSIQDYDPIWEIEEVK